MISVHIHVFKMHLFAYLHDFPSEYIFGTQNAIVNAKTIFGFGMMKRKILIVADTELHISSFEQALMANEYDVTAIVNFNVDLASYVFQNKPDVVVVDVEVPLAEYLSKIREVNAKLPTPVVMFTQMNHDTSTIENAIDAGVQAYVVNNFDSERISTIIETAVIRFSKLQGLKKKLEDTQVSLQDRKVIDRAKGLLMDSKGMKEEEAYGAIKIKKSQKYRKM